MRQFKWNQFLYLILNVLTLGFFTFYVAYKLNLYEKDVWYSKWYYWVLAFLCGFLPGFILLLIFNIKMSCLVSSKLSVPGEEVYLYPYFWILCLVVPILGWSLFIVLYIYVHIWYVFLIKNWMGGL